MRKSEENKGWEYDEEKKVVEDGRRYLSEKQKSIRGHKKERYKTVR